MNEQRPPAHLVELDQDWSLWRCVCLRGAGFPAANAARLAAPEAVRAADRVLEHERAGAEAARAARLALERELAELRGEVRKPVARALRLLASDRTPNEPVGSEQTRAVLGRVQELCELLTSARARLRDDWLGATAGARAALRQLASAPDFRRALCWQNRRALHAGIAALLRQPADASDFKTRQNEALVANYVQRYALKNDSIGFFGPVGWGTFDDRAASVALQVGPSLVQKSEVFFEYWGVERLAARLSEPLALRRFVPPRLSPTMRLAGATLHYPLDRKRELPLATARLLSACDGRASALQIAERLTGDPECDMSSPEEVFDLIAELTAAGVLHWQLELAPADPYPARQLRSLLANVPNESARAPGLAALAELDARRCAVARASGDVEALEAALTELESTFVRLTGTEPWRRDGEVYAGRTLVYEDCRRDAALRLGPQILARLARPLALLLASARWYTHELARRYGRLFEVEYSQLAAEIGSDQVDFLLFLSRARRHLADTQYTASATVRAVADDLTAAWTEILRFDPEARRVTVPCESIAAQVRERFHAAGPGWPSARFHSPDLLIAARDLAAIERGDYVLVLGELHAGWNTFAAAVFMQQHEDPEQLRNAVDHDIPFARVSQVEPKDHATRLCPALYGTHDIEFEIGPTRSARAQVLASSSLVLQRTNGAVVVRTRSGSHAFDLIAFMEGYLLFDSMAHFRVTPPLPHVPRIVLDGVVVTRESWRLAPEQFGFARADGAAERFLAARRAQQRFGLPRHVFVKVPEEAKPVYVDFDSPSFVDGLVRLCRRATEVTITEMLPTPEQTWLSDAQGNHYTSELRMVARDQRSYRAPELESEVRDHHERVTDSGCRAAVQSGDPRLVSVPGAGGGRVRDPAR